MTTKRYLPPNALTPFLKTLSPLVSKEIIGHSVNDLPIYLLSTGKGKSKILMWSQMHGNESTTTRALLDFIPWFTEAAQKQLQEVFSLSIILQLNPDGAEAYTRVNANGIDLNRDAIDLSQPESRALHDLYHKIKPDYCLNLHGQRTLFSAGKMGKTASLSFLAPSADKARSVTPARKEAMQLIVALKISLDELLPNQIGRYDDAFNPNCVGDKFTQQGTPTLLFEAGHIPGDYQREITRKHLFDCFKILLNTLLKENYDHSVEDYYAIPENAKDFVDLIVTGVTIQDAEKLYYDQELAIQYKEELHQGKVMFKPLMMAYGTKLTFNAHKKSVLPKDLEESILSFEKDEIIFSKDFNAIFSL